MKKFLLKTLLFAIMIALSGFGKSLAGTNASFAVSFTIPVMPGINAPLIEEDKIKTQEEASLEQTAKAQEEKQESSPELIQQDEQQKEIIANGQQPEMLVKTLYSR